MTKFILFLFFLSPIYQIDFSTAENICSIMFPRGGDEDWGIGALLVPKGTEFELYQNQKSIGTLKSNQANLRITTFKENKLNFNSDDIEFLGHVNYQILKVKEITKNGEAIILWKTFKDGIKVNLTELKKQNIKFFTYQELLLGKNDELLKLRFKEWANIGVNIQKSCLNLRKGPSIKFSKIKCIPGNDWKSESHIHLKLVEFKGTWAKVKMTKYIYNEKLDESGEGCTFDEVENLIGWVKAVDDSGFPNIWYSTTAY